MATIGAHFILDIVVNGFNRRLGEFFWVGLHTLAQAQIFSLNFCSTCAWRVSTWSYHVAHMLIVGSHHFSEILTQMFCKFLLVIFVILLKCVYKFVQEQVAAKVLRKECCIWDSSAYGFVILTDYVFVWASVAICTSYLTFVHPF